MPRPDRSTQVRLSRETADTLRRLAAELGFLQTRGIMAGELGSIAQMFEALARGELRVQPVDKVVEAQGHPLTTNDTQGESKT